MLSATNDHQVELEYSAFSDHQVELEYSAFSDHQVELEYSAFSDHRGHGQYLLLEVHQLGVGDLVVITAQVVHHPQEAQERGTVQEHLRGRYAERGCYAKYDLQYNMYIYIKMYTCERNIHYKLLYLRIFSNISHIYTYNYLSI